MLEITVGCDPEVFVTKDGKFRSAHGLIPGTKEKPHPVPNGAVQVDGMALEFNTDPAKTADEFVHNVTSVLGTLREMVPGYELAIVPSCRFNGNHFRMQPDEAKELGCTPDFNAYTMKENPKPDNKTTMRTAAGHAHLGFVPKGEDVDPYSDDHMMRCATLVKQLDVYLGLTSAFYDRDLSRRKMYGAAGSFRPKTYGVEYRVLSNAWLLSPGRMRFVFNQSIRAINDLIDGKRPFETIGEDHLQALVNKGFVPDIEYYLKNIVPDGKKMFQEVTALI